jgi:RNA polymerase sigma-70 factor, ECF subfamily
MAWIVLSRPKEAKKANTSHLLKECRAGSREAFGRLFELHKDRVYSVALGCLDGDSAAAEDITQDVFLRLATHLGEFRGEAQLSTYIYRITVNLCLNERERRRRKSTLSLEGVEVVIPSVSESLYDVHAAIARLDESQQHLIFLRYFDRLDYEEIATILGCPPGTVGSRLHRVLKKLEGFLGESEEKKA